MPRMLLCLFTCLDLVLETPMRIIQSTSGRQIIEHDVYSVETGKVSYVIRGECAPSDDENDDECSQSPETSSSKPKHSPSE